MLKLKNITKTFNGSDNARDLKIALKDVSLHIKKGEFVVVIGSNGSGKSTLFNMVSGALKPTSGTVVIDSVDVTSLSEHKRAKHIGIVFQNPLLGTAANMSIYENLILAKMRAHRKTFRWCFKKDQKNLFYEKLKTLNLDLETRLSQKIGLLSGGQRQAVTLLMATLEKPKLLLLDEHTAALDPKTAKTVLKMTEQLVKDNNLTTIMVTHNMKDALTYGNRLIMLSEGKIVYDIKGEKKKSLSLEKLIHLFYEKQLTNNNN